MLCRLYVIHRCKKLKQLDFRKVKQKEREEAARVIGDTQQPAAAGANKPTTFEPDEELAQAEAATAAAQQQVPDHIFLLYPFLCSHVCNNRQGPLCSPLSLIQSAGRSSYSSSIATGATRASCSALVTVHSLMSCMPGWQGVLLDQIVTIRTMQEHVERMQFCWFGMQHDTQCV